MKFFEKVPVILAILLFGFASCTNDYEPIDEKGVSFMTLSVSLSEDVAVPDGSVAVTYGASRNGTDTVSANLSADGKLATAKLDEYFASSSGKFTKLSFSVKKADGSEISVKADKSSIKFDKDDGASISLSAKTSSGEKTDSSETVKTEEKADNTDGDETQTDKTKSDETTAAETKSDETQADETIIDETKADETQAAETKSDETQTDETSTVETKPDETQTDEATTEETQADETKTDEVPGITTTDGDSNSQDTDDEATEYKN